MSAIKSGVYEIRNKVTGHCYIGSSVNMQNRKNDHFYHLRTKTHHSPSLQNAYNKYGKDAFEFFVLEEVPDLSQLIQREQYWMDTKHPKYNWNPTAGSRLGSKQPEHAIEKLRVYNRRPEVRARALQSLAIGWALPSDQRTTRTGQKNTEEQNQKIARAHIGMKHSPETLKKISQAKAGKKQSEEHIRRRAEGMKGHAVSEETRKRIAEANRATWAKRSEEEKHRIATNRPPISEGTRQRLRDSHKGQKVTPETLAKKTAVWNAKSDEEKAQSAEKKRSTWATKTAEDLALIAEKKRATRAAKRNQSQNTAN